MKRRINKPQSILALATLLAWAALCLTACINQGFDPDDNSPHAHLTLLQLGNVTIADAQTAADATTRAATTVDPATGFIGIRKTKFVAGDVLKLTFFNADTPTQPSRYKDATYNGTAWTLDERIFTAAGTIIRATYSPAAAPTGHTHKDDLTSEDIELPVNGDKTTFTMKHLHAMIEVTPPAGKTVSNVVVNATPTSTGTVETLATAQEVTTVSGQDAPIYRTIAKQGTVTAITLTIDGNAYTATLATALTVEWGKRYPIALSMKENELIATVGTATLGWGAGTDMNLDKGYTKGIATAEDLAQFAYDVNNNLNGANTAVVMQTANIDLSKLKTAADANTAAGTNKYTYTATKDQWVPIGSKTNNMYNGSFKGKYNGNGYTISGLKMTKYYEYTNTYFSTTQREMGLFGNVKIASFTGIHIRGCSLVDSSAATDNYNAYAGALIANAEEVTVALCSATGKVEVASVNEHVYAGGLIGRVTDASSSNFSNITRCSSAVDVTGPCHTKVAGFVGSTRTTKFANCIFSGSVTYSNNPYNHTGVAFNNSDGNMRFYYCAVTGTVSNGANSVAAFGEPEHIVGCYAVGNYNTFPVHPWMSNIPLCQNNALTGTLTTALTGVTAEEPVGNVYSTLTAGGYISPANNLIKTLHWSETEGYTLTEVERQWKATEAWKSNTGQLPTLNLAYEGETTVP